MEVRETVGWEPVGSVPHRWLRRHVVDGETGRDGVLMDVRVTVVPGSGPVRTEELAWIRARSGREFTIPVERLRLPA